MKSYGLGCALAGLSILALGAWQPVEAGLCMCHPSSCLLINPNNDLLNDAELHCPMNVPDVGDLMILRFIDSQLQENSFASFPNLTALEIFQGVLTTIQPGAFQKVPSLRKIIIRHNHLNTLEDETFRGLERLAVLFIIDSELTAIAPNALAGLKNLTHLTLRGNKLTQLPEALFAPTPSLETIILANNHISSNLPAGLFDSIIALDALDLSHNQLASFQFPSLKLTELHLNNNSLTSLYLSNSYRLVQADQNRITTVSGTGNNLRKLVLSENRISEIGPIVQMTNLTTLSLSSNPLKPDTVFNTLNRLQELLLSHTNLHITAETFGKLPALKLLDLSYNNMTELDFNVFSDLIGLQTLIVAFNKIDKINFIEQQQYLPKLRVLEICGNGWNTTYLEHVLGLMRKHRLKADMHGLAHTYIFQPSYVELCATGQPDTSQNTSDDYFSEHEMEEFLDQDIAEFYPSSSTTTGRSTSTRVPYVRPTPPFIHRTTTARMIPTVTASPSHAKPSAQPTVQLVADDVIPPMIPEDQPVAGASPLYVTFQVIVYTFAVFGLVALGVVAYYMHQRRGDVRRISVLDGPDSVRLV